MKRTYWALLPLLAILLITTVGCSEKKRFEKKLIGKWELDTSAMQNSLKAENDPASMLGASLIASVKVSYDFQANGELTVSANNNSTETKWKITQVKGDTATIKVDDKEASITFISKGQMEFSANNSGALIFNRVK